VSALHGRVSQRLWEDVWAGVPRSEVPITSVTNGIHTKTWASSDFLKLYDQYLPGWEGTSPIAISGARCRTFPTICCGNATSGKSSAPSRSSATACAPSGSVSARRRKKLRAVSRMLNPEVLTIGFARRFATYKRATLLFADQERLHRLLNNAERPVQFVFAGKAHPKDEPGKRFIQEVYKYTRMAGVRGADHFCRGL
jgi:starch phosphorylase